MTNPCKCPVCAPKMWHPIDPQQFDDAELVHVENKYRLERIEAILVAHLAPKPRSEGETSSMENKNVHG